MTEENKNNRNDDKLDMTELKEAIAGLPESVQNAVITGVRQASAEAQANRQANQPDEDDDDNEPEEVDFERLSRNELVGHLDKRMSAAITKAIKPLVEQVQTTADTTEADRIRREFREAANVHPDFMEWKDEMKPIITKHPELSAEDIYLLARSKNPEKAKELDEKVEKAAKKDKPDEEEDRRTAFGGLTPTSGKGVSKDTKKSPEDAASAAWEEIMSQVPTEVLGGNT